MKILKSSSKLFTAAFVLLIVTNVVVFLGVYFNRSGETTSETTLTQRELSLPYSTQKENNGISLKVVYRTLDKVKRSPYTDWLDATKLKELGFDTDKYLNSKNNTRAPTKELFIVLENDGKSYEASLKLAEEDLAAKEILYNASKNNKSLKRNYEDAKKHLNSEQLSASRLFAIDAGLDYEILRQKYANKVNYIIVKGLVRLIQDYKNKQKKLYGHIQQLSIQKIHVPYDFKHVLADVKPINGYRGTRDISPKYKVEVKYGSRYEPWISSVKRIY